MEYRAIIRNLRQGPYRASEIDLALAKKGLENNAFTQEIVESLIVKLVRDIMPSPEEEVIDVINAAISINQINPRTIRTATRILLAIPKQDYPINFIIDYLFSSWIVSNAIKESIASPLVYRTIKENLISKDEEVFNCIRNVFRYLENCDTINQDLLKLIISVMKIDGVDDEIIYPALTIVHNHVMSNVSHPYASKLGPVWKLSRERAEKIEREGGKLDLPIYMESRADQMFVLMTKEMVGRLNYLKNHRQE